MIALFSALLGFISSAVPDMFKLFRDARDREHEVALLKLQMDYEREKLACASAENRQAQATQLQAIELNADASEQLALNARVGASLTGIHWVDALNGTVRPVLAYAFFLLYAVTKFLQYSVF